MTHWKTIIIGLWGFISITLVLTGLLTTNTATRFHFRFVKDWHALTVYDGDISYSKHSILTIGKASTPPVMRLERVPITRRDPDDLFKNYFASGSSSGPRFSPFYFYEKHIASASLSTLFLLGTTLFTLLYLLQTHHRKKTTALPTSNF